MAELMVLAVVVGLVVLLLWPAARAARRQRTPQDQGRPTTTRPRPPERPAGPVPGSREHRRRRGKP